MRPSSNQTCFQQTIADQIKKSKKGLLLQQIFPLPYQRIPIAWTGNRKMAKMNKLVSPVVATLVSGIALSRQWIWDTHLGWVVQSSKEYNVKYSINVKCSNFTEYNQWKSQKWRLLSLQELFHLYHQIIWQIRKHYLPSALGPNKNKHCQRHNGPMGWHHNWRYLIACKFGHQVGGGTPHSLSYCLGFHYWHHQLVLTSYLHQSKSH